MQLKRKVIGFYLLTFILLLVVLYSAFSLFRAGFSYHLVGSAQQGWSDGLTRGDRLLGHALSRNTNGHEIFYDRRIAVNTNAYGMRVDANNRGDEVLGRKVLFLGDSFTFGAAVEAKHTFPQLVAGDEGFSAFNAAVPSYGVAHLVLQAEALIPSVKPDAVVVQYSPWLIHRSMSPFMETRFSEIPQPYISADGGLHVAAPLSPNRLAGIPVEQHISSSPNLIERIFFVFRHALPAILKTDYDKLCIFMARVAGRMKAPASDPFEVTRYAYERISGIARSHGAQVVILVLGSNQPFDIPSPFFPAGVYVVDAQSALIGALNQRTPEEYVRRYWHWAGNPPVLLDYHPNRVAHRVIADTLISALQEIPQ